MRWTCLAAILAATLFAVGTWRANAPVEPEMLAAYAFAASLLLLATVVIWVWWRYLRAGQATIGSLIERVPPLASWASVVIFVVAVSFYALASLQYSPPSTGQLRVVDGAYVRNNHGTLVPTTREDFERSIIQAQRGYATGAVATGAVAFFVAAAGHAACRRPG
ncbi:MAG TPA: hypothetical protein VF062_12610 [Candidatus Limnocylindrales bacterium]